MIKKAFLVSPIQHSDVELYIKKYTYAENANGENDAFNCWGFLRHVQRVHFGVDLPITSLGDPIAALHGDRLKAGSWRIEPNPFHGAGVLMRAGNDPHCGVWLDFEGGGVLHCERGNGVVWQRAQVLKNHGYSKLKFYRFEQ